MVSKVTKALQGSSDSSGGSAAKGTQASVLKDLSEADAIKKVGALFTAEQKKSGILASVSLAQFIMESGYGKSELAQNANNIFGMKCGLSGNTWSGSSWDGKSKYTKKTQEQNPDRSGKGSSAGWGRLKSGIGWISSVGFKNDGWWRSSSLLAVFFVPEI